MMRDTFRTYGVDTYDSLTDERHAEVLYEYLANGGEGTGPIVARLQTFARLYKREAEHGRGVPEEIQVRAIRDAVVPMILNAMAQHGATPREWWFARPSDNAYNHAAVVIYERLLLPDLVRIAGDTASPSHRGAPGRSLGTVVEARMNAAAQKAGLLGRRR